MFAPLPFESIALFRVGGDPYGRQGPTGACVGVGRGAEPLVVGGRGVGWGIGTGGLVGGLTGGQRVLKGGDTADYALKV